MTENIYVIATGTDPESNRGGIAFALRGYFVALEHAHIPYKFIATHHATAPHGKWLWLLKALPAIWKEIRKQHKNGKTVVVYAHAGAAASLLRQNIVMTLSRLLKAKTVLQIHARQVNDYLGYPLKKILFRLAILPANTICVLTPWWKNRLQAAGIKQPLAVVPNPLPASWEALARLPIREKQANNKIQIVTLTRLEKGKGVGLVIEAMRYLPNDYSLTIAGDGSCAEEYKTRAAELQLEDRVHFTGWVSGDDKQRLFEQANLFCLPSSNDSFGMGFVEAMANGLPVVALDWGPISDVVPNASAGTLIDKSDPQLLSQAIKDYSPPEKRKTAGIEGKRWIIQTFGVKRVGSLLNVVIEEACS